ncbi:hypothetical protein JJ691_101940 [Kutzneria sp. CA-103260]|nr:hypothetical protein JJ691_101940 [Kutzneria sp. CA-103260]
MTEGRPQSRGRVAVMSALVRVLSPTEVLLMMCRLVSRYTRFNWPPKLVIAGENSESAPLTAKLSVQPVNRPLSSPSTPALMVRIWLLCSLR